MKLAIVSGSNPNRYRSHVNHAVYARLHGLPYHLDFRKYEGLQTPHFHKLRAILRVIDRYDWVLWLDDDAFFTDFSTDMRRFIQDVPPDVVMVACRSPINPEGGWTFLNSGVFFVRSCPEGRGLLEEALNTPKLTVEAAWRPEVYGMLTPGEQAHIIYVLHRNGLLDRIRLHDFAEFNARPYHWPDGAPLDLHSIVHFPGSPGDRATAISVFAARFGLDATIVPTELLSVNGADVEAEATGEVWTAGRIADG